MTVATRRSRTLGLALLLALLVSILVAAPASAGVTWCRADPIVKLGGAEYQVLVAVPQEHVRQINAALAFTFTSQTGTPQQVLFLDAGFNGYGETVTFASSLSPTNSMVLGVTHTGDTFPVRAEIYKNGKLAKVVDGTSDTLTTALP